jgi:hypothetical protein
VGKEVIAVVKEIFLTLLTMFVLFLVGVYSYQSFAPFQQAVDQTFARVMGMYYEAGFVSTIVVLTLLSIGVLAAVNNKGG